MKRADVKLWVGRSVSVSGPSATGGWHAPGFVISEGTDCVVVWAEGHGARRVLHDGGYWVDEAYVSYVDGERVTE